MKEENTNKKKGKWFKTAIWIILALLSYFVLSKWATSADTYKGVINTLNHTQNKALKLTALSSVLATGAASLPGDATTPVANKLADMSSYMVIVYVAILIEKYLLTLTGFIATKILMPIGFGLAAIGGFLRKISWKDFIYRIALKCVISGLLVWALVPSSAWVTNWITDTYEKVEAVTSDLSDENQAAEDKNSDKKAEESQKENGDSEFSILGTLSDFADQAGDTVKKAGQAVPEKIEEFENALNQMIEKVAVLIVTTCVIPILVLLAFLWIFKIITGLNLPTPTMQSIPKGSSLLKKKNATETEE